MKRNIEIISKMECTICYESDACCDFVCGHSFCYQCVKTWYQKGTQTCPMCRRGMCFRGLMQTKKAWDREKRENILSAVIEDLLWEIDEDEHHEYGVCMLGIVYDRFNKVLEEFPTIDDEVLNFLLRVPWLDLNTKTNYESYEFPTYTRYLMVPKTSYGVHRKIKCVI